jgi:hypothetical protein
MGDELGQWSYVGQIAAPFAGDAQLATWPIHLFEEQYLGSHLGGLTSGNQTGCATSYHDYPTICHSPLYSTICTKHQPDRSQHAGLRAGYLNARR